MDGGEKVNPDKPNHEQVNAPKLRLNTRNRLQKRAVEKDPGCWVFSPGRIRFYTYVEKALIAVARQRGWEIQKVEYIRLANLEKDPRVWFYPTDGQDPERLEVKFYKGRAEVNASDTLAEWDMALPKNQSRRYDVAFDTKNESPVGPALYFDMDLVQETRINERKDKSTAKKKSATTTQPAAAPPTNTQPTNTQPTSTQPTSTQPTNTQPANTQPANTQPTPTEPTNTPSEATEKKPS